MRTYNLFISHRWDYPDDYDRLVNLLDSAPGFSWKNFSVPEHKALEARSARGLRRALRTQMRLSHAVLTIAGVYASYSEWMLEELDLAKGFDKPIIAIAPWGSQNTSVACREAAVDMVNWSTVSIVSAIESYAI